MESHQDTIIESSQDDASPHRPASLPERPAAPRLAVLRRPLDYWLLWIIALASFTFNLYLVRAYLDLRTRAARQLVAVVQMVGEFRRSSFDYTFNIDEELPVKASIPVDFTVQVPVKHSLPIATTVTIPIETFLGTYRFNAPIYTTIDVDFNVDVPVNQIIDFQTTVPVKFDVPVSIAFADTPLGPVLDEVYGKLVDLAGELGASGLPTVH